MLFVFLDLCGHMLYWNCKISLFFCSMKESQTGFEPHESKWWQDFHVCLNYFFSSSSIPLKPVLCFKTPRDVKMWLQMNKIPVRSYASHSSNTVKAPFHHASSSDIQTTFSSISNTRFVDVCLSVCVFNRCIHSTLHIAQDFRGVDPNSSRTSTQQKLGIQIRFSHLNWKK